MASLPEQLFIDPIGSALTSRHSHLAVIDGDARRYPPDVAPFAALARPTDLALWELHSLLAPGESVWLAGTELPSLPELHNEATLECTQMVLGAELAAPPGSTEPERLGPSDADDMVRLTQIAFPGYFRSRTWIMGSYYGYRSPDGELIAMAGERMALEGYTELSAVCTHPDHRGRNLAAALIARVARDHRAVGVTTFLHVGSANSRAIDLYERLGFVQVRRVMLTRLARAPVAAADIQRS